MLRRLALGLWSHRTLAIARWDLHFMSLRLKNLLTGSNARLRAAVKERAAPVFVNLGSGPRGLADAHWINIDGFPDRNVHFLVDFARGLPFDDASLDGVFCEHVLEHFSLDDGELLMREVRRSLKPGGSVRIIVPDAARVIGWYRDNPEWLVQHRGLGSGTAMEAVNQYFRQRYEHQFLYDAETMETMLRRAGFSEVRRESFGVSAMEPSLVLDDAKYEVESLYVDARR